MPIYSIICPKCSREDSIFRKIAEMDNLPGCTYCGTVVERRISAPMVIAEFQAYRSPNTGKIIESRDAQREDLRRSGAILYESGVEKDVARNKIDAQEKAFAPIAAAVDNTVRELVNAGKVAA